MSNDTNQNQVQRYSKCRNVQRTIKLSLIDDLREELRKIANTEGMDNASKRT